MINSNISNYYVSESSISDPEYTPHTDTNSSDSESYNSNENNFSDTQKENENSKNISSFLNSTGLEPCDENRMYVDKSKGRNGDKKANFCVYCHKKQLKLARHLELKHKNEDDVRKFVALPKKTIERRQIIEIIRKRGNYLFNTDSKLNDGELIVSRRPNQKYSRHASYFIPCGNCKAFFAKNTLRWHYARCSKTSSSKSRSVLVSSKRVIGRIHPRANEEVRKLLFPTLREDNIVRSIRYDELIIIYANKMVQKYKHTRHFEMIRSRLRLIGRFLITMQELNGDVSNLTSVFDPKFIDSVTEAINLLAGLKNHIYKTPTVAFSLGTLIKQIANILINEAIKKHRDDIKTNAENFLKLFNEEITIGVNRTVAESQFQQQRRKTVQLPSHDDIKKLNIYLTRHREEAFNMLTKRFSIGAWTKLAETTLTSIQVFNRRRAGEVERILIDDFLANQGVSEDTDKDLFRSLSQESQQLARKYVRFVIRGKLNRNVPVLLDCNLLASIKLILQHRKEAGVPDSNPYVFGISSSKKTAHKYLRSCNLMRKFAESCGAQHPDRLRGTKLRKHIATTCITLNLSDTEVSDLANFMGHRESIHKNFYRQPLVNREILKMSKLLEIAQGANNNESDSDSSSNDIDETHYDLSMLEASSLVKSPQEKPRKRSSKLNVYLCLLFK